MPQDPMCTNNFLDTSTPPLDPALQSECSSTTGSPGQLGLQRLSINIRMGDHSYMKSRAVQMHDGLLLETSLPEAAHSHNTPSTSAYGNGDIHAYTTVSSYTRLETCVETRHLAHL